MAARTLMIQGTGSDVGKSVLVSALCRYFARQGVRVAPFKAQNMSNNSFVTPDGKEIGRAQAVQAAACCLVPRADFNPVLIKPSGEHDAQLIVLGSVAGSLRAGDFGRVRRECAEVTQESFQRLSREFDLVILEGAGSPAEVNLREYDIVNMWMARRAKAPVLLVGDIDRGGVLASLVGTMILLSSDESLLVKGFVINKFRGDVDLLMPGVRLVEELTTLPCIGVVPFFRDLELPEEDALNWKGLEFQPRPSGEMLRIGVADLPCISNFTDIDSLAGERDVQIVRLTGDDGAVLDALIFPGTKNTPQALRYVKEHGFDRLARRVLHEGGTVIGLCGGYQILGRRIRDPQTIESSELELEGLGLLDVETVFVDQKLTVQVHGMHQETGHCIKGYEVHMGRTVRGAGVRPYLELLDATSTRAEGAISLDGRVIGTYVHGLFDAPLFRRSLLNRFRHVRGWLPLEHRPCPSLDEKLDRWADFVAHHLNVEQIGRIIEQGIEPGHLT